MNHDLCPCGSGSVYRSCCGPFLAGTAHPRTPEQLMRSRYTAFSGGQIDYLLNTHHPSKRQAEDRQTLAQTIAETEWLGLRVLHADGVQETATVGSVEFVAFYKSKEGPSQLHEKSSFLRQSGRWYYLDGIMLPPFVIGRNDPCWCGSGKKYKKCHGG